MPHIQAQGESDRKQNRFQIHYMQRVSKRKLSMENGFECLLAEYGAAESP
jgi:hypothetical protein